MNSKQAIALALGTVAALILVMTPRTPTPLRKVSVTQVNGEITTTYQSHLSKWQPALFAVVVLVTGASVIALRRRA